MTRTKPRDWNIPITYPPKIEPIRNKKFKQTIRKGDKFIVGDRVSLFKWLGKPYRSPWAWRTEYFTLNEVIGIMIYNDGIMFPSHGSHLFKWDHGRIDNIAKLDFIDPPKGIELGNVLKSLNKIPDTGLKAQIIRWNPNG